MANFLKSYFSLRRKQPGLKKNCKGLSWEKTSKE